MRATGTINGRTGLVGVVGYPLAHTLSPVFQNYMARRSMVSVVYVPFAIAEKGLDDFVAASRSIDNMMGFNVTIPYKERVASLADTLSPEARATGAVNTVVIKNGVVSGHNTDVYGIRETMKRHLGINVLEGCEVVLIGAGGAARAALYALRALKPLQVTVINRSRDRADSIVSWAKTLPLNVRPVLWDEGQRISIGAGVKLIINATPCGLHKERLPVDFKSIGKDCKILDMTYAVSGTPLVTEARRRGIYAVDGLGMLVYQGVRSFELWTGKVCDPVATLAYLRKRVKNG